VLGHFQAHIEVAAAGGSGFESVEQFYGDASAPYLRPYSKGIEPGEAGSLMTPNKAITDSLTLDFRQNENTVGRLKPALETSPVETVVVER